MYLSFIIDSVIMVSELLDIYCLGFSGSLGYVPLLLLENPLICFFLLTEQYTLSFISAEDFK